MKKTLLFLSLFFTISAFAQNVTIQGKVTDKSGEALIGAVVKAGNKTAIVDVEGNYIISVKSEGTLTMECSYVGFQAIKKTLSVRANETQTLDFSLDEGTSYLNTVTVTSGRYEKPLGEVTVSLEVIKPALIESNNSQSVDKILEKVPGFNIIGGQANIRGGSGFTYGAGSRVLILVDDIPALQADAGSPNWNDFQMETIEQIEILKGASSALYGSSALNGVVNIRTAYAKEKPITTAALYYTSYRNPLDTNQIWWNGQAQPYTTGLTASHRQKIGKLDLVLGGAYQATKSFNQFTSDTSTRLNIGTRYHINDRLVIGANANLNYGQSNYFFYWKGQGENAFRGATTTLQFSKKLRYTIDPYLSYYGKKGFKHKILGRYYFVDNAASQGNQNRSKLYYAEYQAQKEWANGWVTTAGLVGNGTSVVAELYGDTSYTSRNYAPYLQLDKKIGKLNISTGFRYEYNELRTPELVPLAAGSKIKDTVPNGLIRESKPVFRLGLNYQLAEYTYLRASFGQGYRFPTIAEKFITSRLGPAFLVPNTKLQSETGWSSEIGIKQGVKIGNWSGFFDAALFWTEYQRMIEFAFVAKYFGFQAQNVGDTRIKGLDVSFAGLGKIGNVNVSLLTGYTLIDPRFKVFGDREKKDLNVDYNVLKYRNKHSFKFDGEGGFKGVTLGFSANYLSNIEAIDKAFEQIIPDIKTYRAANNKGNTILDIRAGVEFFKYYKLSLLVKNMSNVIYQIRPGIMEAPRNISVRLDVKI